MIRIFPFVHINNSHATAYNNVVEELVITERKSKSSYITYLYNALMNEVVRVGGKGELFFSQERTILKLHLSPALHRQMLGVLAEILGIGYKYEFLKENLRVSLSKREKKLLAAALIAADFEGDKSYILARLPKTGEYALDGIYAFRLVALREKWQHILSYIPGSFSSADLTQFCEFLVRESRHKIYLKDGAVFGENFARLKRSCLMGEENAETEIILSDAGFVYCLGEVEVSLGDFLQKYFAERAIFS